MKKANGGSHVVPCNDPAVLVGNLKEDIVKKLCSDDSNSERYSLALAGTESIISDQYVVGKVLQDGDSLLLMGKY